MQTETDYGPNLLAQWNAITLIAIGMAFWKTIGNREVLEHLSKQAKIFQFPT